MTSRLCFSIGPWQCPQGRAAGAPTRVWLRVCRSEGANPAPGALPASKPCLGLCPKPVSCAGKPGFGPPRPNRDLETGHLKTCRGRREGSKAGGHTGTLGAHRDTGGLELNPLPTGDQRHCWTVQPLPQESSVPGAGPCAGESKPHLRQSILSY